MLHTRSVGLSAFCSVCEKLEGMQHRRRLFYHCDRPFVIYKILTTMPTNLTVNQRVKSMHKTLSDLFDIFPKRHSASPIQNDTYNLNIPYLLCPQCILQGWNYCLFQPSNVQLTQQHGYASISSYAIANTK